MPNLGSLSNPLLLSVTSVLILGPMGKECFLYKFIGLETHEFLKNIGATKIIEKPFIEATRIMEEPFLKGFEWVKRKLCGKKGKAKQNPYTGALLATPESDLQGKEVFPHPVVRKK